MHKEKSETMEVVKSHECEVLEKYNCRIIKHTVIAIEKFSDGHWYWSKYNDKRGNAADGIGYCPYCGEKLN